MGENKNSTFFYLPPTCCWSEDTVNGSLFLHSCG